MNSMERFEYPFTSRYAEIDGVRLHYIDEGEGPVLWLMHGMPMWSYVYRKIIPPLVKAGYRCFSPDLMGFGLSDKPLEESAHSLRRHIQLMTKLIEYLDLHEITVICQDWGGPIALQYAIHNQENVHALVILNTFVERFPRDERERHERGIITSPLPVIYRFLFKQGAFSSFVVKRLDIFRRFVWKDWQKGNGSKMFGAGFRRPVDPRAMENYQFPHEYPHLRAGIAAFAKEIPEDADHPNAPLVDEIKSTLRCWDIPVLVVFPDGDIAWDYREGQQIAEMCRHAAFHLIPNTGHYLQEDAGEELVDLMLDFLGQHQQSAIKAFG